jgi:putative ABC transport system permease protein
LQPASDLSLIVFSRNISRKFTLDITFIALLVGAVGIITTLYTSVNERVKEIGTMKATGAKPVFILALFLTEALLIGILGATSGVLMGIGGAYVLTGMSPHSSSAAGGGQGGAPGNVSPIFVPSDLLPVWFLSLLLSLGAAECQLGKHLDYRH